MQILLCLFLQETAFLRYGTVSGRLDYQSAESRIGVDSMDTDRKKIFMIGLLGVAALLWGYHFTRIELEFPETHIDGLLVCSEDDNDDFMRASDRGWFIFGEPYKELFHETLANSVNIDNQVMAIAARNDIPDAGRVEALANLTQLYPGNRLGNILFLNECAVSPNHPFCDKVDVEAANAVNQDNAMSWALLAVYRAAQDDEYGVDRAMARAASAPIFEDYFGVQIGLLRSAIPPESDYLKIALIWDQIARNMPSFVLNIAGRITHLCGSADAVRSGLHQSCLNFGERMQVQSKSTLMRLVGSGVQQVSYEVLGNEVEVARLEQEFLDYSSNRMSPGSPEEQFNRVGTLLIHDLDLVMFWLENLAEHGEGATTMANTLAEAKRRSADPDYAPCKSPGLRIHYR